MPPFTPNPIPRHPLVACLFVLTVAGSASGAFSAADAQQNADRTATIEAVLRDRSDAALPGVNVTLVLQQCRCQDCEDKKKCACCPEQRSATSDDRGVVTFVVPGGRYKIRAELAGFATVEGDVSVEGGGNSTVTLRFSGDDVIARHNPTRLPVTMNRHE